MARFNTGDRTWDDVPSTYLEQHEHIHHINGIRDDNRIENLQIVTHVEHMRIHNRIDMSGRVCSICGSKETLKRKNGCFFGIMDLTERNSYATDVVKEKCPEEKEGG